MITLAIETSSTQYSVALFRESQPIHHFSGPAVKTSDPSSGTSTQLTPAIDKLLKTAQITPGHLELIAVSIGPGSFTGLRIGLTSAKTLAFALNIPLVAVDTFQVIATQATAPENPTAEILIATNAQRRQLFTQSFRHPPSAQFPTAISELQIEDRDAWLQRIPPNAKVAGGGIRPLLNALKQKKDLVVAEENSWEPTARTVGKIGIHLAQQDSFECQLWSAQPTYFRPSAAEEKLASKTK